AIPVDDERAHPLPLSLRVREYDHGVRDGPVRDPHLLSADREPAPLLLELCTKRRRVAAGARFGEPEREDLLTPRTWLEVGLPLLLSPPLLDGEHAERSVCRE